MAGTLSAGPTHRTLPLSGQIPYGSRMATASLISMVTSWILMIGVLIATFLIRRLRTIWFRWMIIGFLLGNSGGLIDRFAQDRHWPWHQQIIVSGITLMLATVGLVLTIVAAFKFLYRRDTRTSADHSTGKLR